LDREVTGRPPSIFFRKLYFLSVSTSQNAWMTPGKKNNRVKTILIQKWVVAPTCKKAATGGRIIAKIIFTIFIVLSLFRN
jgi:hypothetical protein